MPEKNEMPNSLGSERKIKLREEYSEKSSLECLPSIRN